jgi:hypothetical protein
VRRAERFREKAPLGVATFDGCSTGAEAVPIAFVSAGRIRAISQPLRNEARDRPDGTEVVNATTASVSVGGDLRDNRTCQARIVAEVVAMTVRGNSWEIP